MLGGDWQLCGGGGVMGIVIASDCERVSMMKKSVCGMSIVIASDCQ